MSSVTYYSHMSHVRVTCQMQFPIAMGARSHQATANHNNNNNAQTQTSELNQTCLVAWPCSQHCKESVSSCHASQSVRQNVHLCLQAEPWRWQLSSIMWLLVLPFWSDIWHLIATKKDRDWNGNSKRGSHKYKYVYIYLHDIIINI